MTSTPTDDPTPTVGSPHPHGPRRGRWSALAVTLVLGVAACSAGDDDTASDDAGTTTPATTSSAATTTTVVPTITTDPPPSTTSTTTTTTTTLAPTTTEDPTAALAEEVEAAYLDSWEAYAAAGQMPNDEDAVEEALKALTGPAREAVASHLHELASRGQRLVPSRTVEAETQIVATPVQLPDDPMRAVLEECETDSWVLVEAGAGPGGGDAIVNDAIFSYRNRIVMVALEGEWLVESATESDRWAEPWCGEAS